jgi:hypothetical protein
VLFSVAGINATTGQTVTSLARNGTGGGDTSGPSSGTLVLGNYGTTNWTTQSFTIGTTGDYLISFAAYNWYDTDLDPVLYLGTGPGSITGATLTAVPEPSTYAMFAGVAMLGFAGWRRRKNR